MLTLKAFQKIEKIEIKADLQLLSHDTIELIYKWSDPESRIDFSQKTESENTPERKVDLWQATCFEAFIQPVGSTTYYEVNLNEQKAWNVFKFSDYRSPQPPEELVGVEVISIDAFPSGLRAKIKFQNLDFKKIKVSLTAVVVLSGVGLTYWAVHHADQKPNFHHFDSFIIEKGTP